MALFAPYYGTKEELSQVSNMHEGYVYLTTDDVYLFADVMVNGVVKRLQLNALASEKLRKLDPETNKFIELGPDDFVSSTAIINVAHGGTGKESLDKGKILTGNGTDPVSMLAGTGAISLSNGTPTVGTMSIENGGTGATTADKACDALGTYTKNQANAKVAEATSKAYTATLSSSSWAENSTDSYTQTIVNADITCGSDGTVPLLCACSSTDSDILSAYYNIDHAEVDVQQHAITFYTEEIPEVDIPIVLIDVK